MRVEGSEVGPDEPEDGWVGARPLIDTEVLSLVLCRFTGERLGLQESCQARVLGRHPDVICHALFLQADALQGALAGGEEIPEAQSELRRPYRLGEAIAVTGG